MGRGADVKLLLAAAKKTMGQTPPWKGLVWNELFAPHQTQTLYYIGSISGKCSIAAVV